MTKQNDELKHYVSKEECGKKGKDCRHEIMNRLNEYLLKIDASIEKLNESAVKQETLLSAHMVNKDAETKDVKAQLADIFKLIRDIRESRVSLVLFYWVMGIVVTSISSLFFMVYYIGNDVVKIKTILEITN